MFEQTTDDELIDVIRCHDRQGLPLERRFEGDDAALREATIGAGVNDVIANMTIVAVMAMREALVRGLTITRPN